MVVSRKINFDHSMNNKLSFNAKFLTSTISKLAAWINDLKTEYEDAEVILVYCRSRCNLVIMYCFYFQEYSG
jgi:hypothetical protein